MKAFVDVLPENLGKGIYRISDALKRYRPADVELVRSSDDADVTVVYVIGRGSLEHVPAGRHVIMQLCYLTTETPTPEFWQPVWERAKVVFSYYDLPISHAVRNFVRLPLGADPAVFTMEPSVDRDYLITTSGYVASRGEAIQECYDAAEYLGKKVFHLGPAKPEGMRETDRNHWMSRKGISDQDLSGWYRRCSFVSGLRYGEGFELPIVEGLLCGARPICFDIPCYRDWFDGHAVFVPHVSGDELKHHLISVMANPPHPVNSDERRMIAEAFSWEKFATAVWERILA